MAHVQHGLERPVAMHEFWEVQQNAEYRRANFKFPGSIAQIRSLLPQLIGKDGCPTQQYCRFRGKILSRSVSIELFPQVKPWNIERGTQTREEIRTFRFLEVIVFHLVLFLLAVFVRKR